MSPTGLVARLRSIWGEKEPEIPQISTTTAIAVLILYTLIYVVPFYLSPSTRPSPTLSRDAPSVIKNRIRSVTISCTICAIITFISLTSVEHGSPLKTLHKMGLFPIGTVETCRALALTAILFQGPLFESGIFDRQWKDWIRFRGLGQTISGWIGYRNFIAGPITEEVLFRSCSVPFLLLSQASYTTTIFLAPIIFGLAHVHHFYEFRITNPHVPIIAAVLRSVLQFTYTTLFGGFATFVYLRTGSILACTVVHTFCNWQGLPRFWGRLERGEEDRSEAKRYDDRVGVNLDFVKGEPEPSVLWTVAYYVLLCTGAYGFYRLLWILTESESALVKFP